MRFGFLVARTHQISTWRIAGLEHGGRLVKCIVPPRSCDGRVAQCCAAVPVAICVSGGRENAACEGDLLVSYMKVLQPLESHDDGASVPAGFALVTPLLFLLVQASAGGPELWSRGRGTLATLAALATCGNSHGNHLLSFAFHFNTHNTRGIQLALRALTVLLVGGASGATQLLGCRKTAKMKSESGFWATCLSTASQALIPLPLNPKPQLSMSPLFSCPPLPTGTWIPADLVLPWLGCGKGTVAATWPGPKGSLTLLFLEMLRTIRYNRLRWTESDHWGILGPSAAAPCPASLCFLACLFWKQRRAVRRRAN